MTRTLLLAFITAILLSSASYANNHPFDITYSYPLAANDPRHLYGSRFGAGYQPQSLVWEKLYIYFEASYGYWHVSGANSNRSIGIYSIAPMIRYYLVNGTYLSPFFEGSIGASYLTKTRIGPRNLGMHFSFQDQLGLGVSFGKEQRLSISIAGLHYSNGSLCEHNSGITIPVILNASYRF